MAHRTIVAFPVIGAPLPPFPLAPEDFLGQVARRIPHWIYHVEIGRSRSGQFESPFHLISPADLMNLADRLRIGGVAAVRPREFVPGGVPKPNSSPYAFGYPLQIGTDSAALALAVGLVACAASRPLPPWVLLTGCLAQPLTPDLRLEPVANLQGKLLLALGRHSGYHLGEWLGALYQHPNTQLHLGRREKRVWPGRIRLVVAPTDLADHPLNFALPLEAEAVELRPDDYGHADFDVLRTRVEPLAGDGLLLIQVPTAFDALRFLGYHHLHAVTAARGRLDAVRAYRIRLGTDNVLRPAEATAAAVQHELAELNRRISQAKGADLFARLRHILDHARKVLRCPTADLALVGPNPEWLRVVARLGRDTPGLPNYIPRWPAYGVDVLAPPCRRVVSSTAEDPTYLAAASPANLLRGCLGDERFDFYRAVLGPIRSYVRILLCRRDDVLGALFVHRPSEGPFPTALVDIVEALARRAAEEVAPLFDEEQQTLTRIAPLYGEGSVPDLARRAANPSRPEERDRLGSELARVALTLGRSYRVVVRLISADGTRLETIGNAGGGDAAVLAPSFPLDVDAAATFAFRIKQSYIIPDAGQPEVHLEYFPPLPQSHAAILLRARGHVVGTLSVDWAERGACNPAMQGQLEELAGRYALLLRALNGDLLLERLDDLCRDAARTGTQLDLREVLTLAAGLVGARDAALFLRGLDDDTYRRHDGLVRRDGECLSQRGRGLVGYVAQQNRPLRLADLHTTAPDGPYLGGEVPERVWYPAEENRTTAALAVPIAVRDEVAGVILLLSAEPGAGFDSYDQKAALAAASRLAGWLPLRREGDRVDWAHLSSPRPHPSHAVGLEEMLRSLAPAYSWLWGVSGREPQCRRWLARPAALPDFPHQVPAALVDDLGDAALVAAPGQAADPRLGDLLDGGSIALNDRLLELWRVALPVTVLGRGVAVLVLALTAEPDRNHLESLADELHTYVALRARRLSHSFNERLPAETSPQWGEEA